MTITPPLAAANAALIALCERHGCARVDTPVLQPADLFLDLSGEDIRRRLFLTVDQEGREMCLRPEYTIPVCRRHLEAGQSRADYCYLGPVFRQRVGESGEFLQAGIESIGREDISPADADVIGLALDGLALYRTGPLEVRIGDMGLLDALMRALHVPTPTRRRLLRDIAAGRPPGEILAPEPRASGSDHAGLLAAIEGQDPRAARAFVEDVLSIAGIARVGGRTAGEIAERFLSRAENRSGALSDEARQVLATYLAIQGDLDGAAAEIRALARNAGLDLEEMLDRFEERTGFMAARGLAIDEFRFRADFARSLDYYTGFIFEIRDRNRADGRLLAAGGRYDRLLDHLGGSGPIPAVGCSFWLDRLEGGQP
jgi:ATP phosphoribosyltransferase regulatory subunit